VGGLSSQKIGVYQEVITFAENTRRLLQDNTIFPIYQQTGNSVEMVITKPGIYFVVVLPSTETLPLDPSSLPLSGEPVPFSITLQTPCDAYCVNPSTPNFRPACQMCGNAILEEGEECDNGNNPGCNGCFVVQGYACYGNPGSSSLCIKNAVCGDGVLDKGEQCDNGNRAGCSTNCILDAGYKCSTSVGYSSVCGFCGNGVVEPGEECDNKNGPGCSNGCKIDVGFDCRGSSSFCTRKKSFLWQQRH
jgi:cysteine-rich repeat protein